MNDEPTILKWEDVEKAYKNSLEEYRPPKVCNWCEKSYSVREVGPNYICYDCEKKERGAGNSIIFTSPVKNAYWSIKE